MSKLRLQIQILPQDEQGSLLAGRNARQDDVRPWTQPEAASNTLQQLVDNIATRYARIYIGRGALKIKELQDAWGGTLDLTDRVGDIFNDRSPSGDILTSICKVLRYPPDPTEIHDPHRYASLLPESSARPQKRPPPPLFDAVQRPIPSIEDIVAGTGDGAIGPASKRRKTHDVRTPSYDKGMIPLRNQEAQDFNQAYGVVSRTSLHHITDSQPSLPRNFNAYDTPIILSGSMLHATHPQTIPDSPSGRRTATHEADRGSTKSESPELRLSVHEIAPLESGVSREDESAQTSGGMTVHEGGNHAGINATRPGSLKNGEDLLGAHGGGSEVSLSESGSRQNPSVAQSSSPTTAWREYRKAPGVKQTGPDVFDAIESDTEGFREKQQMFPAKRLSLSKTPSDSTSLPRPRQEGSSSRRPVFKMPALPRNATEIVSEKKKPSPSPSNGAGPPSHIVQQLVNAAGGDDVDASYFEHRPVANGLSNGQHEHSSTASFEPPKQPMQSSTPSVQRAQTDDVVDQTQPKTASLSTEESESRSSDASSHHHPDYVNADHTESIENCLDPVLRNEESNKGTSPPQQHHDRSNTARNMPEDVGPPATSKKSVSDGSFSRSSLDPETAMQTDDEPVPALDVNDPYGSDARDRPLTGHVSPKGQLPNLRSREKVVASTKSDNLRQDSIDAHGPKSKISHEQQRKDQAEKKNLLPDGLKINSSRSKALKEQRLKDQAERLNLAADGAKQLEIERNSRQNANTPKTNGWVGAKGGIIKSPPRTEAQKEARRLHTLMKRDEMAAAENFRQRSFGSNASNASVKSYGSVRSSQGSQEAPPLDRQDMETPVHMSNTRAVSEARSATHTNPDSMSDCKRRTLTPLIPGTAESKRKRGSSPTGNGAPLRSALKQPFSNLRRSASQVSFGGPLTTVGAAFDVAGNNNMTPSKPKASIPSALSENQSANSVGVSFRKQTQTILNVTRDKKMKGRVLDPIVPSKESPEKQSDSSSDGGASVSSYISDEDVGFGISKAGPSTKRKLKPAIAATADLATSAPERILSSIDPALQALGHPANHLTALNAKSRSNTHSTSDVQRTSNKSSPSQATGAITISSGSSSDFESDSESENRMGLPMPNTSSSVTVPPTANNAPSSSSSEVPPSVSSASRSEAKQPPPLNAASSESSDSSEISSSSSQSMLQTSNLGKSVILEAPASSHSSAVSFTSSTSSKRTSDVAATSDPKANPPPYSSAVSAASSSLSNPASNAIQVRTEKPSKYSRSSQESAAGSNKPSSPQLPQLPESTAVNRAVSKQLQRETQDSLGASLKKTFSTKDSSLPNGVRSANFRYPSLSQLKREAEGKNDTREPHTANGLIRRDNQTLQALDDLDSDSEDDTEDSSSVNTNSIPTTTAKSRSIPGMKGLMKLVNRSNGGKK